MLKETELNIIKCPYCGREYTIDEIYLPNSLLGKTREVMRMVDGTIDIIDYINPPDLNEKYECDGCGNTFTVKANLSFTVSKEIKKGDFKIPLYPEGRLILPEDD